MRDVTNVSTQAGNRSNSLEQLASLPRNKRDKDAGPSQAAAVETPGADRVELSEAARNHEDQPVRNELVSRVRTEIASDAYLTDEKIDATIEKLLSALNGD